MLLDYATCDIRTSIQTINSAFIRCVTGRKRLPPKQKSCFRYLDDVHDCLLIHKFFFHRPRFEQQKKEKKVGLSLLYNCLS